jgi:DNA polymerase
MTKVHIDFETYSEADLPAVGAWVYSQHPSTEVICMAWAVDDEPPRTWLPVHPIPARLKTLLSRPTTLVAAWNSFFEWCIWHHTLQWDALPLSQWEDTMAKAAVHNLPLKLDKCAEAIHAPNDFAKDKRGKYLINKLCKPQKGFRLLDRDLLNEMYEYCEQDVVAERYIDKRLAPLSVPERRLWELDQKINIRGVHIDTDNAVLAQDMLKQIVTQLKVEVSQVTNDELDSTNSRPKVLNYLAEKHQWTMEGYTKNDVKKALADPTLPEGARTILSIRQREGKTSTAKYRKLVQITAADNRAHGLLQFHAASTGRWGGRLFQPHNLPRPDKRLAKYAGRIIETFSLSDALVLEQFYGEPMECMSTALRGMITSPKNKQLYVGDYSQIEARALAWMANQLDVLAVFSSGQDVYKHTAAKIYRIPYSQVTDEQRFIGKIATLAMGYQGGYRAFIKFAEDFGVDDIDEAFANGIKDDWRNENQEIVKFWYALEHAAVNAMDHPNTVVTVGDTDGLYSGLTNIKFVKGDNFLQLILPSGRALFYFHPTVTGGNEGYADRQPQVRYWGTDSFTKQWRQLEMYGGKWAQHACEGVCRDLLGGAMLDLESNGFDMVLSVHDENIAEREAGHMDLFSEIMKRKPDWAEGLPVDLDTFAARRYRK